MDNPLTNQFISDTYNSLLHVGLSAFPNSGVVNVEDGEGKHSSLSIGLSGEGATLTGQLTAGNVEYPEVNEFTKFIDWIYPIGSVIFSASDENPSVRFSGTVWKRVSEGRFVAGVGEGTDKNNNKQSITLENNFNGEYRTKLEVDQLPPHTHTGYNVSVGAGGAIVNDLVEWDLDARPSERNFFNHENAGHTSTDLRNGRNPNRTLDGQPVLNNTGSGKTHNNVLPSYGMYIWKRTQ